MCSLQEHIERDIRAREAAVVEEAEAAVVDEAKAQREQRTAYWGTCDECLITVTVYPHPDRGRDLPDSEEWPGDFAICPVCESWLEWEGSDPAKDIIRNY
ncbi:hypothetical protein SEA_ELESAR_52 [Arthrobacter phage Elesar]|uniref:Uncharacterized protein n=1 Tax=Arthrobacter phage Elesar TaxID=2510522 RepID=A0A411CQW0_9CAUD|nr:hypothetical protein QEO79_gp44 [Arthrobacter phage Elesar]QAY16103.1 hypothetical protein SEA_ELESAR_52 [Arthrobacter phage Elesar]